jgi:ppGpp synthetase/RelA/SpoT-type nucleotidyltranferase
MSGDERQVEEVAQTSPDVAQGEPATGSLDGPAGRVAALSTLAGNAAVAALVAGDARPPPGLGSMVALARAARAGRVGTGAAAVPLAPADPDDGLAADLAAVAASRALARQATAQAAPPTDVGSAATAAEAAYEALNGLNDVPKLLQALRGRDASARWALRAAFQERYSQSLGSYLVEQLGGDDLVLAASLLEDSSERGDHVALGLALIPVGTREAEIWRILEGATTAGRREIERRYNQAFGSGASTGPLSYGSLRADLRGDLSGDDLYRAEKLLDGDLTPADRLYMASVGIVGTRDNEVISIIQKAWQDGPAAFAALERDWAAVQARETGVPDLRTAMSDELSLESWRLVAAVLDAWDQVRAGVAAASGVEPTDLVYKARFDAAYATYNAAAEGLGTNETQATSAVEQMRELISTRTAALRQAGADPGTDELLVDWARRLGGLDLTQELSGVELKRAQFVRAGALEPADELYLAMRDHDEEAAVRIVTEAWAKGRADTLAEECRTERVFGGQTRPSFNMNFVVSAISTNNKRVWILTNRDLSMVERGARRLGIELAEGSSEGDLQRALAFLRTMSPELRSSVIEGFAADRGLKGEGSAASRFTAYVAARYGATPVVADVRDLVDPVSNIQDPAARMREILTRGRQRRDLVQPGLLFSLPVAAVLPGAPPTATIGDLVHAYDEASGNDVFKVSEESLARLEYLVERATDEEIAAMARERGIPLDEKTRAALVTGEYGRLQERLADVDALVRTVTEALATAVELAVSAAITAATGGAAGGLFLAAMASAVAGMLVREAALGGRYELFSPDNAKKLVTIAAGAGLGAFGGKLLEGAGALEKLQAMGRLGAFAQDAATEAFSQVGTALASGVFADKLPNPEEIGIKALEMLVAVGASGASGTIKLGVEDTTPLGEQLRTRFMGNLTQSLLNASAEMGGELARSGTGDMTGVDILAGAGKKGLAATASAISTTIGEVGAAQTRAAKAEAETRKAAEAEARAGEVSAGEPVEDESPRVPTDEDEATIPDAAPLEEEEPTQPGRPAGHADDIPVINLTDLPGVVHETRSAEEARQSYATSIRERPDLEAGVWRDVDTGQRIVVQGDEGSVEIWWRNEPGLSGRRFVLEAHYHPNDMTNPLRSMPSRADFRVIMNDYDQRLGGTGNVQSAIHWFDDHNQLQTTTFGFDGTSDRYWMRFKGPDGVERTQWFDGEPDTPGDAFAAWKRAFVKQFDTKPETPAVEAEEDTVRARPASREDEPEVTSGGRAPKPTPEQVSEAKSAVGTALADHPELRSAIQKLLDDTDHPLDLTRALHDPARRQRVLELLLELASSQLLGDKSLQEWSAEHPGAGPLFERLPADVNLDAAGKNRKQAFLDEQKAIDPARMVGAAPTEEQRELVRQYGITLATKVEPAVAEKIGLIVSAVNAEFGQGEVAKMSIRTKSAEGLLDKVSRMRQGRPGAGGREDFVVGDIVDAVGARITVESTEHLASVLTRVREQFGTGDDGAIVEIENMYADPKKKAPAYRVIPITIKIEVEGQWYTFELQLSTLRASVIADLEHNVIYKPSVPTSAAEQQAVRGAMATGAALDQAETRR